MRQLAGDGGDRPELAAVPSLSTPACPSPTGDHPRGGEERHAPEGARGVASSHHDRATGVMSARPRASSGRRRKPLCTTRCFHSLSVVGRRRCDRLLHRRRWHLPTTPPTTSRHAAAAATAAASSGVNRAAFGCAADPAAVGTGGARRYGRGDARSDDGKRSNGRHDCHRCCRRCRRRRWSGLAERGDRWRLTTGRAAPRCGNGKAV